MKVSTVPTITTRPNKPRTALVRGGGSGKGEAICRKLGEDGFRVIVADLDMAAAERVAADLPDGTPLHVDVGSEASVTQAHSVKKTEARRSRLNERLASLDLPADAECHMFRLWCGGCGALVVVVSVAEAVWQAPVVSFVPVLR